MEFIQGLDYLRAQDDLDFRAMAHLAGIGHFAGDGQQAFADHGEHRNQEVSHRLKRDVVASDDGVLEGQGIALLFREERALVGQVATTAGGFLAQVGEDTIAALVQVVFPRG
jgi:hypothetical protein